MSGGGTQQGWWGHLGLTAGNDLFNAVAFLVSQVQGNIRTMVPVKVVAVHGGGLNPTSGLTVDVLPLINQIDGLGNATKHVTAYGLSVNRSQGGKNAIINDPVVGDIGCVVCSDRDMSAVKSTSAQSNPGSFRRHNISDGVYHGTFGNTQTPNQYVMFSSSGVTIADMFGNVITLSSIGIALNPDNLTNIVYLGGDGMTGTYAFVQTVSGPSINVKARIS
jgi:hypothetical protein